MPENNASAVPPAIRDGAAVHPPTLGEATIGAIANLYQATAQALSNAAHNATAAQQQTNVIAQAATTQGVATLYALDTASAGDAYEELLRAQPLHKDIVDSHATTGSQVEAVLSDRNALDAHAHAAVDAGYDVRPVMTAFADSLDRLNETLHRQLLGVVKLSATVTCFAEMIKAPEKFDQYEKVLAAIEGLR